jgi:ElaA protein
MVHRCVGPSLSAPALYELLALRAEIFVVEQSCAYLDPDGHDLAASTEHRWLTDDDGRIVAALRVIDDPELAGARRIGRVVCRRDARGKGLAARLVRSLVEEQPAATTLTLHAQSHLVGWYGGLGFTVDGAQYQEDGIPHTPMRRPPAARGSTGR